MVSGDGSFKEFCCKEQQRNGVVAEGGSGSKFFFFFLGWEKHVCMVIEIIQ